MEKDIVTFFKKAAEDAVLTSSEKDETRRFLLAYVDALPVRDAAPTRQRMRGIPALFFTGKFMPVFSVLLAASLAMGGVSFAAEGSLPGDMLYPVKVSVNEEVRAALSVTPSAKADWESKRVERRLEEAERLADKSRLNADARADLEERMAVHAARVNARVDLLESNNDFEGAVDVSSRLEERLSAHGTILSRIGGRSEGELRSEVEALVAAVGSRSALTGEIRAKNADSVADDDDEKRISASARAKMEVAGKAIAAAQDLLTARGSADADAAADARARLVVADEAYAEGQTKLQAGEYGQAFVLFQKAQRNAREASLLIRAQKRGEARVKKNVEVRAREEKERSSQEDEKSDDRRDDRREEMKERGEANVEADAEVKVEAPKGIDIDTEGGLRLRFDRD